MMIRQVTTRGAGVHGLFTDRVVEEVAAYRHRRGVVGCTFRWWCLVVARGGALGARWDGGPWRAVPPGSAVLFAPGCHGCYGGEASYDHAYLSLSGAGVRAVADQGLLPAVDTVHSDVGGGALDRRLERLHRLLAARRPAQQDQAWAVALELLVELAHRPRPGRSAPHPAVLALVERLEAHPEEELDLVRFAATQGISVPHLRAGFRTHTGSAPGRYQAQRRCDLARRLLLDAGLPIRVVGARVGLPHPVSFARFFRRLTGQSPGEFRRSGSAGW